MDTFEFLYVHVMLGENRVYPALGQVILNTIPHFETQCSPTLMCSGDKNIFKLLQHCPFPSTSM